MSISPKLGIVILSLAAIAPAGRLFSAETPQAAPVAADTLSGKVVETMNVASYTYVLIDNGTKKVWAAAPEFAVKVGDTVTVAAAMPMPNYRSKMLQRTFDVVYFTGAVSVNGSSPAAPVATQASPELPKGHPATGAQAAPAQPDLTGIKQAEGGQTVAEIHANKAKLAGKPVTIRGRVVKYNAMIMGKNWIHIRDGSGAEGTNDLTLTTSTEAKVGDLVLVTGMLSANKDFGSGYRYGLIVEDASVTVEKP